MLSDRALHRLSLGLRKATEEERGSDLDPPTEAGVSLEGEVLAGRFQLLGSIAAGGMGVVHRALDLHTGQEVAVKIPNLSSPQNDRRFQIECEALTAVVAPGIVRALGTGTEAAPFLAMELVRGETLARWIRRQRGLSREAALAVTRRIAAALAMVHAAGWVHRDIKPANVTVTEDGDVRLVDFGLARAATGPGCGTAPGHLVGTLSYIAPEQLSGAEGVDARIDVFALGCLLYECLTGHVAFRRLTSEVAQGLWSIDRHPELDPLADGIPADVAAIVTRFTSPAPERRPIDGLAALAELCALDPTMGAVLGAAGGATPAVRGASLGALRTPIALIGAPGSGRTRTALAAAILVTEMLAPCRTLVLRGNPRSARVTGAHAAALERRLREGGFRNAARVLAGTPIDGSAEGVEPAVVVVILDANFCDALSLERIGAAAGVGLLRVLATARSGAELPASFAGITLDGPSRSAPASLSPFERWVLRAGSMFGTVFDEEGAAHLVGGTEAALVPGVIARLIERDLLRPTHDGRLAFVRSEDWYAALGSLTPRGVRLGVDLVDGFERGLRPGPPETFWFCSAVEPSVATPAAAPPAEVSASATPRS